MKKLISKLKVFHLIMLCIAGAIILSALPFKTQYSNIYVNVTTTIEEAVGDDQNSSLGQDQNFLFELFENNKADGFVDNNGNPFKNDFNEYKKQVYDFQNDLNDLNNLILIYGIIALIGVAFLYIFSNNKRHVYYVSNIVVSGLFTLFMVVFGIVLIINSISVMGKFSSDSNLYNIVSVMQNSDYNIEAYQAATASSGASLDLLKSHFDCNVMTFVVYDIIFVFVIVYSLFLFILSMVKFKATSERRSELEKVVAVND